MNFFQNRISGPSQNNIQQAQTSNLFQQPQTSNFFQQLPPQNIEQPQNNHREELLLDIPLIKKTTTEGVKKSTEEQIDFSKIATLKLDSLYSKIKASSSSQNIPLMVSLVPTDKDLGKQRVGLDIVIIIDISGSMEGEKMKLVVETLLFIIDEMQEMDRLSLITFDDNSEILCNLSPMTADAKELFKKIVIAKIKSRGGTEIRKGLVDGFEVLLNRKQINDVTAVFLLSDGQDNNGSLPLFEACLKEYDAKMMEKGMNYKINSFGYGGDHDEKILGLISNFKEGNFYYIKNLQLVDECFIDCMGFLMSVFGSQAEIAVYMNGQSAIFKKYGLIWSQEVSPGKATLKVGNIAAGQERNYICEITIPATTGLNEIKICSGLLNFVAEGNNYMADAVLTLPVVDSDNLGDKNLKLDQNLVRVMASETLKKAEEEYKKGNVKEAQEELKNFKCMVIEKHIEVAPQMNCLLPDDIFEDKKNMMENHDILQNQTYKPSKNCFSNQNHMQQEMVKRKK